MYLCLHTDGRLTAAGADMLSSKSFKKMHCGLKLIFQGLKKTQQNATQETDNRYLSPRPTFISVYH